MHGMYVCTPPVGWWQPPGWSQFFSRPLVKVQGSSPRKGSSPLLIVPTPKEWKAEYTLASRMQIHESLTVLALLTRGEARTSDPWICSLMLYHLSYLTTYIRTYIHTYIHTYIASISELLCLIPILVGSAVATVCPPERETALRTAVTTVTRVPL